MVSQNNRKNKAGRAALGGMLLALALIFGYVETLLPLSFGIPGVKLGLANLVILSCLYVLSVPEVLLLLVARILLSGFFFGNGMMILYSLAGGLLSFCVMLIGKKTNRFSMAGVSILGGVFHNLGQLLLAVVLVWNEKLFFYFPVLLLSGALTGALIGLLSQEILNRLRPVQ